MITATCKDKVVSNLQPPISPPPPPSYLLPTMLPSEKATLSKGSSVFPPCEGETAFTFRRYIDLKEQEKAVPKFWCHYYCPQQQNLSNQEVQIDCPDNHQQQQQHSQLIQQQKKQQQEKQQQQQQQQQQLDKLRHAHQDQSDCYVVRRQDQGDSCGYFTDINQQGGHRGFTKLSTPPPAEDCMKMGWKQGVQCCHNARAQQHERAILTCSSSVEENERQQGVKNEFATKMDQTKVNDMKHNDPSVQIVGTSSGKAEFSTKPHVDKVTIDNFTEVMCLDAAATDLNEDSDSQSLLSNKSEDSFSSDETQQISDETHSRTRQIKLCRHSLPRKEYSSEGMKISNCQYKTASSTKIKNSLGNLLRNGRGLNKRNTQRPRNIKALEEVGTVLGGKTPSISEMNKLANALSRASFVSKNVDSNRKNPMVSKYEPQLARTSSRIANNIKVWPHGTRQLPHGRGKKQSESYGFSIRDLSNVSYFTHGVSSRAESKDQVKNTRLGVKAIRQKVKTSKPVFGQFSSINSKYNDSTFAQSPTTNVYPPDTKRRLVVTDKVYCNRRQSGAASSSPTGPLRRANKNTGLNNAPLSLNNSQTKENNHNLEKTRFCLFKGTNTHQFERQQLAFPKPQPLNVSALKDKCYFNFGKIYPDQWQNSKSLNAIVRDADNQTPKFSAGYFGISNRLIQQNVTSACFSCLIPRGAALVELMSKRLNDMKKLYKHKTLPMQIENSGGGVSRVCHKIRYCPYPKYKMGKCSKRFRRKRMKLEWHRAGLEKYFGYLDFCGNRNSGLSTVNSFPKPFFKSPSPEREPKLIDQIFKENQIKTYNTQLKTNAFVQNIPIAKNQILECRDTHGAHRYRKRRGISTMFEYRSPQQVSRSERLRTHKPELGEVFLIESPKFSEAEKCNLVSRDISFLSLQHKNCKTLQNINTRNQVHLHGTRNIPGNYTTYTCRETESACRLAASRADSDTSRSRLLPMRPEIKSTDISNGNAQISEPSRLIFTYSGEQGTPEFKLYDEPLSVSVNRAQTTTDFGWNGVSDTESDGLFQVSGGSGMGIKNMSFKSELPGSPSSFWSHSPKQREGQNIFNGLQKKERLIPLTVDYKPYLNISHVNKVREAIRAKFPLDQEHLNATSNKSLQIPRESLALSLNNMSAVNIGLRENKTKRGFSSAFGEMKATHECEVSKLKLEERSGDPKKKSESSTMSVETIVKPVPRVNTLSIHDSETDSGFTPSIGFVTRIVEAHRHKLYSHKAIESNSQEESRTRYPMFPYNTEEEILNNDDFVQNQTENEQNYQDHGVKNGHRRNTCMGKKYRYKESDLNMKSSASSFMNNLSCSEHRLSFFGELTVLTDTSQPPSPRMTCAQNRREITSFGTRPEMVVQDSFKAKTTNSNSTSCRKSSFPSHIFPSPSSPRTGFSLKTGGSCESAVSPSGKANTDILRKLAPCFNNNVIDTYTSPSTVNLLSAMKKSKSNREYKRSRSNSRSSLKAQSANIERPPLPTNSPTIRRSCRTFLSSDTPTSMGIHYSPDTDYPPFSQLGQSLLIPSENNISSSSLASQRNNSQTQMSAKSQRLLSMNKSRMSSASFQRKITSLDTLQTVRTALPDSSHKLKSRNLPEFQEKESQSAKTSKDSSQAQMSKIMNIDEDASKLSKAESFEAKAIIRLQNCHVTRKETSSIANWINCQPQGKVNIESTNSEKGNTLHKIAGGKYGQRNNLKDTENQRMSNGISLGVKADKKNKHFLVEKPQDKLEVQNFKTEVHHNVTAHHTNQRSNRKRLQDKREFLTSETQNSPRDLKTATKATGAHCQSSRHHQETMLSKSASLEAQPFQSHSHPNSTKLRNLKPPQQSHHEIESKHFQQNANILKQERDQIEPFTPQKSVTSLGGMFHISPSFGRESWFRCSPTDISLHRNGTYNKSPASSLLNYEQSKCPSPGYRSEISYSELFGRGGPFTACNSNSELNKLTNISGKPKETIITTGNTRASFLLKAKGSTEKDPVSSCRDFENTNLSQTVFTEQTKLNSLEHFRSFRRGNLEKQKTLRNQSRTKQVYTTKLLKKEKGSVFPLKQRTHIQANKKNTARSKTLQVIPRQRFTSSKSSNISASLDQELRKIEEGRESGDKATRLRVASGRSHITGRALSTNNSAAVFPKDILKYWGGMKFSDKMMVLRLPEDLLCQSNEKSNHHEILMTGLRGEGDGCAAGDTLTRDTNNLQEAISQHLNFHTAQCERSLSFDWYKPAARTHRRRTPLRRCQRQSPRRSEQCDPEETSLSGNTMCNSNEAPSFRLSNETISMHPAIAQNRCQRSLNTVYKISEGPNFRKIEALAMTEKKQFIGTSSSHSIDANVINSLASRLPAIKSLSCSDVCEAGSNKTSYFSLKPQTVLPRLYPYIKMESTNASPSLVKEPKDYKRNTCALHGIELSLLLIGPNHESKSSPFHPFHPEREGTNSNTEEERQ